ncbi:tetratricopeptide repeat protein [Myxococcota bacterium]|nr:tetratricopeptide repeat protein [Myxococcota bacterium]
MQIDRPCATPPRLPISGARAALAASLLVLVAMGCTPSPESRLEEVRELQATNKMDESIPILIELIESGNRQGEILYRYGRALSLTGKPERSIWALDAAREDPEWFLRASQQLAVDAQMGGNYDFALEVFERLHEEAPEEIENDPFALLLETRVLLDTQTHFEKALELVDTIIERFPDEETAIRMKAVALLGLKRPDEAYELLRSEGVGPEEAKPGEGEKKDAAAEEEVLASDDSAEEGKADPAEGASDEPGAEEEGDDELYLEIEDESREAYWCTVRTSFKREAGETEEATKIVDACLAKYPNATELMTEAIKLYSELGRFDRVLEILENAYKESPDSREIRDAYVQFLGRVGRDKEVESILRKTIDEAEKAGRGATPETAASWVDLAGFLMAHDRVGEALVAFDKVNQIVGDNASPDLLLREAEALIRAREYDEALKMADKTPVEVHQQMLRGRIAFERGEYPKALELLGKAALLWPDNAPIRYYRARAAEGVGDLDLAVEEYRHAVRSDPTLSAPRERLAKLHLAEGNFREAASILTFQSPRKPSDPSTAMRILMVEVETMRGTEPDLEIPADATHSNEKVRRDSILALSRGLSYRAGPRAAAGVLSEFEKESVPAIRGAFLRERVELMGALGDVDGAVAEARAGLKARPNDLDAQLALGRALLRQGKALDEAERVLKAVAEKRPNEVDVLTAQGDLAEKRGDLAASDAFYERALVEAPDHWAALQPILDHLTKAGRAGAALERLEAFVVRDSPYDGRAVLELARRRSADEEDEPARVELVRRAIRFGAGKPAIEFLATLDPAAASEYEVIEESVPTERAKGEAKKGDEAAKAAPKSESPPRGPAAAKG